MLYVFSGSDSVSVRTEAHRFLESYEKQGTTVERIAAEECTRALLRDYLGAQSLFVSAPKVVLIDTPSERADALRSVEELAEALAESPNIFVLIEGKLLAADAKILKAHATEVHAVAGAAKAERFNVFVLADALGRRDKKTLWILYTRAVRAGLSPEELAGTLFWQLKVMRLASVTSSAEEAELKPFVYTKAKRAAQKFSAEELTAYSRSLLTLYHDARLGGLESDLALERWILSV